MSTRWSRTPVVVVAAVCLGLGACAAEQDFGELVRPAAADGDNPGTAPPTSENTDRADRQPLAQPTATILPATPDPTRTPKPTRTPRPPPEESDPPEKPDPPEEPDPPEPTPTDEPPDPDESEPPSQPEQLAEMEDEVIELTNAERTANGCDQPLRADDRLREAARVHTDDMAERNYLDHVSPEGDGPGERAAAAGYPNWSGENIARGYPSATSVVDGWMGSEGHRKNILNCESKAIGVGAAEGEQGFYWTQLFGFE